MIQTGKSIKPFTNENKVIHTYSYIDYMFSMKTH